MKAKYKIGQFANIKATETTGEITHIAFYEEIKQYTYELLTKANVHYTVCESEIELVNLTTK